MSRRAWLVGGLCLWAWRVDASPTEVVSLTAQAPPAAGGPTAPGPVVRAKLGKPLRLALTNHLVEPATFALAGLRPPSGAQLALAAGESRNIVILPQEPGFGLYRLGGTLGSGLLGAVVIEEAMAPGVDLDAVAVFPAPAATLAAPPGGRVRLRLVNASPDATRLFKIAGARAQVVAIDGQPSEMFTPRDGLIPLGPSARFELMLDMPTQAGARVTLAAEGEAPALVIEARGEAVAPRPAIAALPANPRLPAEIALEKAKQVAVRLTGGAGKGYAVNGVAGPARPLFKAARGSPVSLSLVNATSEPQTMRLEGHVARILHALDDGWDPYWRDTLSVAPGKTLHAAFVADAPGRWPLASASPERRAKGLAAVFEVG